MNEDSNAQKNTGRAVVGFLLTFIMTFMLIAGSTLLVLKLSVLKSSDIDEFLEDIDFHSTVQEVVENEIKNEITEDTVGPSGTLQLTSNAVDTLFSKDVVKDMTTEITDAITKDDEIDLSGVKDKCLETVTDVSYQAIDDVIEEIKNDSNVVDLEALTNSSVIQQYQQDYNVDITATIIDQMQTVYGTDSVNLDDIDVEEVKTEAKKAINEHVMPTIEESVNEYIDEANEIVNEQVEQIKEENNVDGVIKAFEVLVSVVNIALAVAMIIALLFILLQIFVVYKNEKNRAFRNTAISSAIAAAFMILGKVALNIAGGIVGENIGGTGSKDIIKDFVVNNIAKIGDIMLYTGIVYIVIFVAVTAFSFVAKKKVKPDNVEI